MQSLIAERVGCMSSASNESKFKGYDSIFAERLRRIMTARKTKQAELAEELEISRQAVSQYMDGSALPNAEKLYTIAKFFDMPCDFFLGLTDEPRKDATAQSIHDKIGLSFEAIENLEKLYSDKMNSGLSSAFAFDYMLSNQRFVKNYPQRLFEYFHEKEKEYKGTPTDFDNDKTDIAKHLVLIQADRLIDDFYDDFIRPMYENKPGRKRKEKEIEK